MTNDTKTIPAVCQLLTARQCAQRLAISERSVWSLTQRGELRAARLGRSVRYDPVDLANFIERAKAVRQ
jgi:excisionase family DNA binding protein